MYIQYSNNDFVENVQVLQNIKKSLESADVVVEPSAADEEKSVTNEIDKPDIGIDDLVEDTEFTIAHGAQLDIEKLRLLKPPKKSVAKVLQTPTSTIDITDVAIDSANDSVCKICASCNATCNNNYLVCKKCNKALHKKCVKQYYVPVNGWCCENCK